MSAWLGCGSVDDCSEWNQKRELFIDEAVRKLLATNYSKKGGRSIWTSNMSHLKFATGIIKLR
eukprot:UN06714